MPHRRLHNGITRWRLWLLPCILATSCVSATDPALKAATYPTGRQEAEIVRDLGTPDRRRAVDLNALAESCKSVSRESKTALEYFVPRHGASATLRRVFHLRPRWIVIVCLDGSGRILGSDQIGID